MDTKAKILRFIILSPHRDALKPFNDYRQALFSAGLEGAFSFPLASLLAQVSRPFSPPELKELACKIRRLTIEREGKIRGGEDAVSECPGSVFPGIGRGGLSFYGPALDIPVNDEAFPSTAKDKLLHVMSPALLCVALAGHENEGIKLVEKTEKPALVFRAASLANLAIRPLAPGEWAYSFEWKTGEPVWLPAYPKSVHV